MTTQSQRLSLPMMPPDLLVTAPPPPVQLLWPEQAAPLVAPDDDAPLPGPEELPPLLLPTALPPPVQLFCPEQLPAAAWYAGEPPESERGLGALLAGLMSFRACGLGYTGWPEGERTVLIKRRSHWEGR